MAKGGQLTKLKSVLKKLKSFSKRHHSTVAATTSARSSYETSTAQLYPVFVGKSRRRYLVTNNVICHPVFLQLVDHSGGNDDSLTVGCEVVMFEHLLWMLENVDHEEAHHELVQYYAC